MCGVSVRRSVYGTRLSGTIPESIGTMKQMQTLCVPFGLVLMGFFLGKWPPSYV